MYQSKWAPKPSTADESHKSEDPIRPASSSLSAAAPTFSPAPPSPNIAAPPPDVASADAFAQTGAGQDDLFDDVIPADESMRVRSDDDLFSDDFTPVPQPVVQEPVTSHQTSTGTRGRGDFQRGRGRGRGRGNGGRGAPLDRQESREHRRNSNQQQQQQQRQQPLPPQENGQEQGQAPEQTEQPPAESTAPSNSNGTNNNIPIGPRKDSTPSVRGDRHATGGVPKPKLTESELAEKMARISVKNASLTAAHARAEADAASFAQREEQVKHVSAQRQRAERKDRQQMMGEREKNRARKLKAMEGREWDAEKKDEDFEKDGGKYDKRGNFARDQERYSDGREYLLREDRGGGRGGGRGARGGRGPQGSNPGPAAPPKQEDFPALPRNNKNNTTIDKPADASIPATGAGDANASWADQVESSTA